VGVGFFALGLINVGTGRFGYELGSYVGRALALVGAIGLLVAFMAPRWLRRRKAVSA